jgi:hypothetical protein
MAQLVFDQQWNEQMKTNDTSLAKMLMLKPDQLSPVLTYLMGDESQRFPLMYLSEGMKAMKEIEGDEYEYDVIGRLFKAIPLAETVSTANAGIGYSTFTIKFQEKLFPKDYTILTPNGYQLTVVGEPTQTNGLWSFPVKLVAKNSSQFLPASELTAGNLFSLGWAAVASFGSTGNESVSTAPYKVRGDITTLRKSYKWEGNVKYRSTVTVKLPTQGGGEKSLWWPFEEYQHNLSFRQECETNYWYSTSNRDASGIINERDVNGNPIVRGSGILEQIMNKDTFGTLTVDKIHQTIRSTFYGMSDASNKVVTIFTGIGGRQEFDDAMKADLAARSYIKLTDAQFVTGSGYSLALGGYFDMYQHVDGYKIIIKTASIFDNGPQALASPRHPKTGLPLESHRLVFVDTSTYNGENNLVMVTKKGRSMVRAVVKGMNEVSANLTGNDSIATDKDASSIHFMKAGQVVLRRFNTSIDLRCVAGL